MHAMETHDAVVVGAGPAGATAARLLAGRGMRVLVLDRCRFPRDRLCGGLLTAKTVSLLEAVFGLRPAALRAAGVIGLSCRRYAVCNRRGEMLRGRLEEPFHFVERRTYDHYWLSQALQAGARVRFGKRVVGLDPAAGRVECADGTAYRGRVVLGCDGVNSRVRAGLDRAGLLAGRPPAGRAAALEAVFPRRGVPGLPDRPVLFFGDLAWGYGWSFPGPRNHRVGVCALQGRTGAAALKKGFRQLVDRHPGLAPRIAAPGARLLPFGNYRRTPGAGKVLLAGDACGLADPLLGEGIYYAHRSGQLAAAAVLAGSGDPHGALPRYRGALRADLLAELRAVRAWRTLVYTLLARFDFRPLGLLLRLNRRRCEGMIQGRRSFRPWRRSGFLTR